MKCPGQDTRNWKSGDIFEVKCPNCGEPIEFFKDEVVRKCSNCKVRIKNPRLDIGCAEWCQYADQCLNATESAIVAEESGEKS